MVYRCRGRVADRVMVVAFEAMKVKGQNLWKSLLDVTLREKMALKRELTRIMGIRNTVKICGCHETEVKLQMYILSTILCLNLLLHGWIDFIPARWGILQGGKLRLGDPLQSKGKRWTVKFWEKKRFLPYVQRDILKLPQCVKTPRSVNFVQTL